MRYPKPKRNIRLNTITGTEGRDISHLNSNYKRLSTLTSVLSTDSFHKNSSINIYDTPGILINDTHKKNILTSSFTKIIEKKNI